MEDQIQQHPRARSGAESAERHAGGAGRRRYDCRVGWELQWDPGLKALFAWEGQEGHSAVKERWCEQLMHSYCDQQQWWVATAPPWRQRAHLSQPSHGHSWMKLKAFSQALPRVLSTPEDHLSAMKTMAGNSPCFRKPWHLCWWPVLKYPGIASEWPVPDPALGWNREVCCLCHLKRRSFKLVGGQQQALVLGAVYSRLCAAEADTMEFWQSWS